MVLELIATHSLKKKTPYQLGSFGAEARVTRERGATTKTHVQAQKFRL
jgi:hypothetical protein